MDRLKLALSMRILPLTLAATMSVLILLEMFARPSTFWFLLLPFLAFSALTWLGIKDMKQ